MFAKKCVYLIGLILILAAGATAADLGFTWSSPGDRFSGYGWVHPLRLDSHRPAVSNVAETDDSTGYDVVHYNVEIQFFFPTQSVVGKVDMRFVVTNGPLAAVNLNLRDNMVVDSVTVNGVLVTHQFIGVDGLRLNLQQVLNQGDSATATIWYHGVPEGSADAGLFWETHGSGIPIIFSLSEPEGARTWWPCKDIPTDKATSRVVWTVPDNMFATSNGLLQSIGMGLGWKQYAWVENYPITTYLIAVTATNFAHLRNWYVSTSGDSMPLDNYVYPEDSIHALVSMDSLATMIGYDASMFGEYPFIAEKYGHSEFQWGGAMEHQTLTSYGYFAVDGAHDYDWMMAHELSHQWWGDLITCQTWADIWLNEGFATYCDALWAYHEGGMAVFLQRMAQFRQTYIYWDIQYGRYPIYNPPPDLMWGSTSYEKGAWVLHMIRHVIGEQNFANFWHVYRDAYAPGNVPGNVNTAELQQTLEPVSGMDLGWFFNEWVYMAGYPEYHWGWQVQPQGANSLVQVSIQQTQTTAFQTPEVFTMPVPIRIITATDTLNYTLQNNQRAQNFSFLVPGSVADVQFDPDSVILKTASEGQYVEVLPSKPAQPFTQTLLTLGPNPANPSTVVSYQIPGIGQVRLTVWDTVGRLVTTLFEGRQTAGEYRVPLDGSRLPSGMYLVRLETASEQLMQKLVILK